MLFNSTEYTSITRTDEQYVRDLYEVYLQRAPDEAGLAQYTTAAGGSGGRASVLDTFAGMTAFRELAGTIYREVNWLVTDHLGTPRMVVDRAGTLGGVKRHDYLPFGEELAAGIGGRTAGQGYGGNDGVRQKFTGHERDGETGLDYMKARYYSSAQGRFTGVDMAGPDLTNPQTLNKYQYCLNNPLRYKDKNGLYEEDVHRDLTRVLAYAAGFSMQDATAIGNSNQGVDDNPVTDPVQLDVNGPGFKARRDYHFTTEERRSNLWAEFANKAFLSQVELQGEPLANRDEALERLGVFFHAQQDSYSHAGYGPRLGHILDGHAPDKTYNNIAKADAMALDTYSRLGEAASRMGVSSQPVGYALIQRQVHAFNAARTMPEKAVRLRIITTYVTYIRSRQEQPIETTTTTIGANLITERR